MAASKKATHVVTHKKLYLAVDGKLQHVPAGTEIVLDNKSAEQMGKKVMKLGEKKAVDLTGGKAPGKMSVDELKAELDKAEIAYTAEDKKADLLKLLEGDSE